LFRFFKIIDLAGINQGLSISAEHKEFTQRSSILKCYFFCTWEKISVCSTALSHRTYTHQNKKLYV